MFSLVTVRCSLSVSRVTSVVERLPGHYVTKPNGRSIERNTYIRAFNVNMAKNDSTIKIDTNSSGEFVRKPSAFRNWVTGKCRHEWCGMWVGMKSARSHKNLPSVADGSSGFKSEAGRYHLYVSLACPWAHRTLIVRTLKGLEEAISFDVVDWSLGDQGWSFTDKKPNCTLDRVNGCSRMREVYQKVNPDYEGRVTVPVLWDKQKNTIVNNESSELIRMLNSEFNDFCATEEQRKLDLYPESLRKNIDEVNEWIYPMINNGVYKSGFASSQEAYDVAVRELFKGLDRAEEILSKTRYLTGNQLTEADVRLVTSLFRFDLVYVGHFKCNKKRIVDYPNLWGFLRDIYQIPGIADTVNFEHITNHYMGSPIMAKINPYGIVSIGPDIDFTTPHGRESMG